jgi:predicted DCC family thiol-disulfide oxidoreductase YuxK
MTSPDPIEGLPAGDLIVFDAACVLCSGFARFVYRVDRKARFRFVSAQSPTGKRIFRAVGLDPEQMESNVLVVDGKAHLKMPAFAAAMRALGLPWALLSPAGRLPDRFYDMIARNRYRLGRKACPLPPPDLKARLVE